MAITAQLVTWRYEGPRVRVKAIFGFPVFGDQLGKAQYLVISALNVGRASVELNAWGFRLPDGSTGFVAEPVPWSTKLPHTLPGGHECKFFVLLDDYRSFLKQHGPKATRAYVSLGTGKDRLSKPIKLANP